MWTIEYTPLEGLVESGPLYEKKQTAELAAAWRSKKRSQNWVAVEVVEEQ